MNRPAPFLASPSAKGMIYVVKRQIRPRRPGTILLSVIPHFIRIVPYFLQSTGRKLSEWH